MATEEYQIGYEAGYQDGWNEAQKPFVGLTEDEILLISAECAASHQHMDIHFARAIEAKLRSKNESKN